MKTYCVKCREKTNSHSENIVAREKGPNILTGICSVCSTKKSTFVSKDGTIREKTPAEVNEAKKKRLNNKKRREALRIVKKILQ